jgi:hypothetical protein
VLEIYLALRDITELMNRYRECSRNLWNVYFPGNENIGASLDAYEAIRKLLFEYLVTSELLYEEEGGEEEIPQSSSCARSSSITAS